MTSNPRPDPGTTCHVFKYSQRFEDSSTVGSPPVTSWLILLCRVNLSAKTKKVKQHDTCSCFPLVTPTYSLAEDKDNKTKVGWRTFTSVTSSTRTLQILIRVGGVGRHRDQQQHNKTFYTGFPNVKSQCLNQQQS